MLDVEEKDILAVVKWRSRVQTKSMRRPLCSQSVALGDVAAAVDDDHNAGMLCVVSLANWSIWGCLALFLRGQVCLRFAQGM